jgi:hypothetical protein
MPDRAFSADPLGKKYVAPAAIDPIDWPQL